MAEQMTTARARRALTRPERPRWPYPDMATLLRPDSVGEARIDHITISESVAQMENLRMTMSGFGIGRVEAGTYARLIVGNTLEMSDTPMERRSNLEFVEHAHGRVLVFGLGLGMILHAALAKDEVDSVLVVEKQQDVITLVEPSLAQYQKLRIAHGDAFTWRPHKGDTFNTIYFDIWPTINEDNLPEMGRLLRRAVPWKDRTDPGQWTGCWMRDYLRQEKRNSNRRGGWW